jgi:hypothetical protein
MATMNNQTLPIPNPGDWMTINSAALLLRVDRRTIGRMINKGTLTGYQPYAAPDESAPLLLWRAEVLAVLGARNRLSGATR